MTDKILSIFFNESEELIQAMETGLLALEKNPDDMEQVHSVFRAAHTIKGNAGFVDLEELVNFTHVQEGVLDRLRQGHLEVTPEIISLLLASVDVLRSVTEAILAGQEPDEERVAQALNGLRRFADQIEPLGEEKESASPSPDQAELRAPVRLIEVLITLDQDIFTTGTDPLMLFTELEDLGQIEKVEADLSSLPPLNALDPQKLYLSWRVLLHTAVSHSQIQNVFIFVTETSNIKVRDITVDQAPPPLLEAPSPTPVAQRPPAAAAPPAPPQAKQPKPAQPVQRAATIRVDTEKLDKLVNLVGELVIGVARVSQLVHSANNSGREMFTAVESLDHISRELQEQVMRVRMVPVEPTFTRFQRVVRDLATELKKEVRLVMSGTETELDKNVIEQINDPLKHLIRNSVDHGLESPEERIAVGKPRQGTIWLRAYQREGNIIIEVADDGRGIDRQAVLDKATSKGLVRPENTSLSDQEIFNFMFLPGFSTAKKVTEVSGRGVGLDVVKRNIEALRGAIEVDSTLDQGTTVHVKLPLTLAIIDGMTVRVGQEIFTVPLMSIIESVRPQKEDIKTVEGSGELVSFRGSYIPLVRLHELFALPTERTNPWEALVIILESRNRKFAVLVDEIEDEIQAVIKSLEKNYYHVDGTAGATILGNGNISLILDIHGLERMAFIEKG